MNKYSLLLIVLCLGACERDEQTTTVDKSDATVKHVEQTKSSVKEENTEWVYIDDGAVQCEQKGRSLNDTKNKLTSMNIAVKASKCAHITGASMATMCGLKDLNIHMHQLYTRDVKKARGLGFEPISSLSHYGDKSYKELPCNTP